MKNKSLDLSVLNENKVKYLRRTLPINNICNNNCMFCFAEYNKNNKAKEKEQEIYKEINRALSDNVTFLVFSGYGEPTLEKNLFRYISYAKKIGIPQIGITTNGRMLSNEKYTKKLIISGLNNFLVSIHSDNSKDHDFLTRSHGSFEQTIKGIKNIVSLRNHNRIFLTLDLVVNQFNYKYLDRITSFLDKLNPNIIHISRFDPIGGGSVDYKKLAVKSEELVPYIKKLIRNIKNKSKMTLLFPLKELYFIKNLKDYTSITGFENESFFDIAKNICKHHKNKKKFIKTFEECRECNVEHVCRYLSIFNYNIYTSNFKEDYIEIHKKNDLNFKKTFDKLNLVIFNNSNDVFGQLLSKDLSVYKDISIRFNPDILKNFDDFVRFENSINIKFHKTKIILMINSFLVDVLREIHNKLKDSKEFFGIMLEIFINSDTFNDLNNKLHFDAFINYCKILKINKIILNFNTNKYGAKNTLDLTKFNVQLNKIIHRFREYFEILLSDVPFCYVDSLSRNKINHTSFTDIFERNSMDLIDKTIDIKYIFSKINDESRVKKLTCKNCSYNNQCLGEFCNYVKIYGFNQKIIK